MAGHQMGTPLRNTDVRVCSPGKFEHSKPLASQCQDDSRLGCLSWFIATMFAIICVLACIRSLHQRGVNYNQAALL